MLPVGSGWRARMATLDLIRGEALGGLLLMAAAALALAAANSPLAPVYFALLKTYLGPLNLLHWINDALMAVFFLLVGLEIKREMVEGQLSTWSDRLLPGIGALGGMAAPALIYALFNAGAGGALRGWAIPTATDIAFALGILALLGTRVPVMVKVILTALAIVDDLAAVIIIALFYTADIDVIMLTVAGITTAALVALNRLRIVSLPPYLLLGLVLWYAVFRSGVHATIAGVVLGMTIPIHRQDHRASPLHRLEHAIHPWSAYLVVPVFGFANAGVSLAGLSTEALRHPVTLGISAGLFLGKQLGVFVLMKLAIWAGLAGAPAGVNRMQFYGMSLLCGIGFTMSLFIGLLAFPGDAALETATKLGVLTGSLLSMVAGIVVMLLAEGPHAADDPPAGVAR